MKEYNRQSVLDKVGKLRELANRGIGGEKANATTLLEKICQKYGIIREEIQDDDYLRDRYYKYPANKDLLFILTQVIFSINPEADIFGISDKRLVRVVLNMKDHIEVVEKYRYFKRHFESEKKSFMRAYCYRHGLFGVPKQNKNAVKMYKDKDDLLKMMKIANGLSESDYMPSSRRLSQKN